MRCSDMLGIGSRPYHSAWGSSGCSSTMSDRPGTTSSLAPVSRTPRSHSLASAGSVISLSNVNRGSPRWSDLCPAQHALMADQMDHADVGQAIQYELNCQRGQQKAKDFLSY